MNRQDSFMSAAPLWLHNPPTGGLIGLPSGVAKLIPHEYAGELS